MNKSGMDDPSKRELKNQRQFSIRLNVFFFATFIIFSVLIVRLAVLQFVEGPTLKEKEASISSKSTPIPPIRGNIMDASGEKIAYSTSSQSLYFTLEKNYSLAKNKDELYGIVSKLKKVFNQYGNKDETMTADQIIEAMDITYRKNFGYTPRRIKKDLTNEEIAYFLEHKDQFPGIEIVEESVRHYDTDRVAVQTVGYLSSFAGVRNTMDHYKNKARLEDPQEKYLDTEFVGVDGIEYAYQDDLRGKNGLKTTPVNAMNIASGRTELTAPEKGNNVWMTIDKNVQKTTQQAITDQLSFLHSYRSGSSYAPNAQTGYAVAMEVDTGNIVAMASMPDYDSNVWESMTDDKYKDIQHYYANGAIREVYREGHASSMVLMGSVIKPLSVLVGLKEGLFTPYSGYQDIGFAQFGKAGYESKVRNSSNHVYGYLTPSTAIEHSSNAFMVDMVGKKLYTKYGGESINVWDKYMKEFGLGVSTKSGLPYESEGSGEYMNLKAAGSAQAAMAYASFGQQGKYTTLQLAQYVATLANKGTRLKPQLVSKITDSEGNIVQKTKAQVVNQIDFPDSYWSTIKSGMKSKVSGFDGFPYDYARKTGTSQQSVYGHLVDNGVFIAYAPRDNPKLAVAVVIPEGGFGAQSAAPVARKIFDAYDQEYGLDGIPKKVSEAKTTDQAIDSSNN
ncbi:cell division protein FtsI/penicillin-binding protein 2 [Paenibacillus sp. SORGH_AS306]|uniref:peptidoglycan D,D-transpeptidase FtsI family protein n=1 Tax=unclassified Paenibacillus TaxID=185978 RepID=UPI0027829E78|nr:MULTISPECIES: penicillin-binding transpeptidase domain-containing protein [unclassified Paenibacillus]MDQ1235557.1 cell division protein FtsI/penicillin-binding protein 2 [Paenibacillus sp. SORGH_AS_0306]MDR6112605.1 cell division protein FtsI/penicillin-binding protein 2 [Paenibacillus sp. SORGH_AS_0338]